MTKNRGTIDASASLMVLGYTAPKRKRVQREHTEDWQTIRQLILKPHNRGVSINRTPIPWVKSPAGFYPEQIFKEYHAASREENLLRNV